MGVCRPPLTVIGTKRFDGIFFSNTLKPEPETNSSNVLKSRSLFFQPTVTRSTSYYMEQGHWFLSLYNDDIESQEVSFVLRVSEELTKNCPNGCNGRGQCILGRCQCEAGYDGPDCGQSKFIYFRLGTN